MAHNFAHLTDRIEQAIQNRSEHYPSIKHPSHQELTAAIDALYDALLEASPSVEIVVPDDIDARLEAMLDRGIMIAGLAKSGTSLLRNLLDNHPQIFAMPSQSELLRLTHPTQAHIPREELYQTMLKRILSSLISHDLGGGPHWLLSDGAPAHEPYLQVVALTYQKLKTGSDSRVGFFRAAIYALVYVYLLQNPDREVPVCWLEQSPGGLRNASALVNGFPHISLLYGIRDPRAVFASTKYRHISKFHNFDIDHFTDYMLAEMQLVDEIRASDIIEKRKVIQYEELVTRQDDLLNETLEFLDLPFHPTILTPTVLGQPVQANTAYAEARKTNIFTGSIDRWRERLSPAEVTYIHRLFRQTAMSNGYELPHVGYAEYARAVFSLKKEYTNANLSFSVLRALRDGLFTSS